MDVNESPMEVLNSWMRLSRAAGDREGITQCVIPLHMVTLISEIFGAKYFRYEGKQARLGEQKFLVQRSSSLLVYVC